VLVEKFTQYRLGWECNGEVINYSTFATNDFETAKSLIEEERRKINNDVEVFLVEEEVVRKRIKFNIVNISSFATPVKVRTQEEITAERRNKRKERFATVKRDIRNLYNSNQSKRIYNEPE
jgi:hypothetical protein